jgi:crossover junction endodeoxyribonuclease RuvC
MPIMVDGTKSKRQVNAAELANILINEKIGEQDKIILESVSAMPGQGVTGMFSFGQSFGVIKGVCAALKLPLHLVRPVKWKKHFNLLNSEKDASRTKVIEMYPYISSQVSKKKDANKADAILIAKYFFETIRN